MMVRFPKLRRLASRCLWLVGFEGGLLLCSQVVCGQDAGAYTQVAVGPNSSYALRGDGRLWAWGINNYGQLGDGSTLTRVRPAAVVTPAMTTVGSRWTQVTAGALFAAALRSDNSLWTWGHNESGELGNGTLTSGSVDADAREPVAVATPLGATAGSTWTTISAGTAHVLALRSDGTLWSWGSNAYGESGTGSSTSIILTPQLVATPATAASGTTWTACAAGCLLSFALRSDGSLWSWGRGSYPEYGALGHPSASTGTPLPELVPAPSSAAAGTRWTAIATGGSGTHTLAIRSDGTLWAWGWNREGALGQGPNSQPQGSFMPVPVALPAGVATNLTWVKAFVGDHTSFGLLSDGSLWGWGLNQSGQLGLNAPSPVPSLPYQEYNQEIWTTVATGYAHSLAISHGQIYVTGSGGNGQLGLGSSQSSLALFVRLAALPLATSAAQSVVAESPQPYPNPALAGDILHLAGLPIGSQVSFYSLPGQLVATVPLAANGQLVLPRLAAGFYMLRIQHDGYSLATHKLSVVQ